MYVSINLSPTWFFPVDFHVKLQQKQQLVFSPFAMTHTEFPLHVSRDLGQDWPESLPDAPTPVKQSLHMLKTFRGTKWLYFKTPAQNLVMSK